MRFLVFILAISMLGLSACKKGKADFTIKGTISDATFGTTLSGAELKLYEIEAGGASSTLISQSTVGSDGSYSFTFPRNASESYLLTIRKNNYFDRDMVIPFSDLTIENDNVRNYSSTARSWARLRFITSDPTAQLKYVKQQGKTDCASCCDNSENFLNGVQDATIICPNDGNTVYSYHYWLLGTAISGEKNATTTAFDTVDIILNY